MLGKLMGFLDILAGLCIVLYPLHILSNHIIMSFAFYLIIKIIIFFGDSMSIIDSIAGIYMLLMLAINIQVVSALFSIYLIGKGLWSLF